MDVEQVRHGYEAFNQALTEGGDLNAYVREIYDPECVLEMGLLEGTIRGYEGIKRAIAGMAGVLDGLRYDPDEIIDGGDGEHFVVSFRLGGRIRSTGLPFEVHAVHVVTYRNGKACHIRLYASKAKAMKDLGLEE
jgi:ketosteroid isomerase-like protein